MAIHWTHPQTTTSQFLSYSPDMDPRGKEKERPPKNNLAAHSRKGEVQSRLAVLERGAHCSARQESMESTYGGPMGQLGARGYVKVSQDINIIYWGESVRKSSKKKKFTFKITRPASHF